MKITPEISRAIAVIAEAKMHFLLASQGTNPGTPERHRELEALEDRTKKAREYVDAMPGGFDKLPPPLAIDLRVCELGIPKLYEMEPKQ